MIADSLEMANVSKLNHEELAIIADMFFFPADETKCLGLLKDRFNLELIVLTPGKEGARLFVDENTDSIYKPEPTMMVDSVGAGDAFTAAVTLCLLKKIDLDRVNRIANTLAAFVCSQKGATPQLPQAIVNLLE